jgi:hypothetical protein
MAWHLLFPDPTPFHGAQINAEILSILKKTFDIYLDF